MLDGSIAGYLIDDNGTVLINYEDCKKLPKDKQYTVECRHRRDYFPTNEN